MKTVTEPSLPPRGSALGSVLESVARHAGPAVGSGTPTRFQTALPPTVRARMRTATRRSVLALLDELSPPRRLSRNERPAGPVASYRTASGCVLQARDAALSVSWFSDDGAIEGEGELHVRSWRGTVCRRGTPERSAGARIMTEVVLYPVHGTPVDCDWLAADGTQYDLPALIDHCHTMLARQAELPGPVADALSRSSVRPMPHEAETAPVGPGE